ncbi:hypothetical protein FSP39_008823 [Pinctada imbricata]|uniref:IgGFc-binding protein N-terminal domain-containing protein n=1 Tax=Pinctada imbricata TaxID=66713 RepID=A0AA88YV31_PINIB|nr:hypothetical protein FSP39_008823 [Pinctada imbricata]
MEYKASMEINVIVFCVILCCVSPQIITTDNKVCSRDDGVDREKDSDYLIQVIKQQAIQIQELSQKFLAQEALVKNISGQLGRDFILSFPYLREVNDITLLLVSQTNTTVTMRSVVPGVNRTVSFSSSKGTSISLPTTLIRNGSYVGNNTVSLHSDVEIAVFVLLTGLSGTGDGYIAIPRKRLRQRYHFSMNQNGVLSFVSFYDETVITISNSTGQIINLQTVGSSQSNTITLQKDEVLQLRFNGFVIGTVEGSKPFMALHGSHLEYFYSNYQTSYIDAISDSEGSVFIIPYLSTTTDSMTICNAMNHLSPFPM